MRRVLQVLMATKPAIPFPSQVLWKTSRSCRGFSPAGSGPREGPEAILTSRAVGGSTWKISAFLEGTCEVFCSSQNISRLFEVASEQVGLSWERSLSEEYYAVFLDGTFLSVRRGKMAKEPVYIALGSKPNE